MHIRTIEVGERKNGRHDEHGGEWWLGAYAENGAGQHSRFSTKSNCKIIELENGHKR